MIGQTSTKPVFSVNAASDTDRRLAGVPPRHPVSGRNRSRRDRRRRANCPRRPFLNALSASIRPPIGGVANKRPPGFRTVRRTSVRSLLRRPSRGDRGRIVNAQVDKSGNGRSNSTCNRIERLQQHRPRQLLRRERGTATPRIQPRELARKRASARVDADHRSGLAGETMRLAARRLTGVASVRAALPLLCTKGQCERLRHRDFTYAQIGCGGLNNDSFPLTYSRNMFGGTFVCVVARLFL